MWSEELACPEDESEEESSDEEPTARQDSSSEEDEIDPLEAETENSDELFTPSEEENTTEEVTGQRRPGDATGKAKGSSDPMNRRREVRPESYREERSTASATNQTTKRVQWGKM